jgi:hypothetical protein
VACPWKIRAWPGDDGTVSCEKDDHLPGDPRHEGAASNGITVVDWMAGDRREYTGDWPGLCPHQPCVLHAGHHGGHAP